LKLSLNSTPSGSQRFSLYNTAPLGSGKKPKKMKNSSSLYSERHWRDTRDTGEDARTENPTTETES